MILKLEIDFLYCKTFVQFISLKSSPKYVQCIRVTTHSTCPLQRLLLQEAFATASMQHRQPLQQPEAIVQGFRIESIFTKWHLCACLQLLLLNFPLAS